MECSGDKTEKLVHKTDFARHTGRRQHTMTTPDHAHDLETSQGRRGCYYPLEAAGRPDHTLERAVTRFDDIVQVIRGPVLDMF